MISLVDNTRTDKNTIHSYLPLYESLLCEKKDTASHILEIGIAQGGSIKLWHDYFSNAIVYGLDVKLICEDFLRKERIKVLIGDAYDDGFASKITEKFDVILDDGPHTLESMKKMIRLYFPKLKPNGILIIEDVQKIEWLEELKKEVDSAFQEKIKTYDLRKTKGRYDDIVFTIQL
jgi:hypothetical protein